MRKMSDAIMRTRPLIAPRRAKGPQNEGYGPVDQQPLQRTVGRRQSPALNESGKGPSASLQALLLELSATRTRVPKGVFRYTTHEEANRDQERWRAATVVARQSRPESS